jgi:hypothetical protein
MRYETKIRREPESVLATYLDEARRILAEQPDDRPVEPHHLDDDVETLRWFWLPEEIASARGGPRVGVAAGWPG